jgi:hypothetical protein
LTSRIPHFPQTATPAGLITRRTASFWSAVSTSISFVLFSATVFTSYGLYFRWLNLIFRHARRLDLSLHVAS